ncbi:Ppx/GppA family phosphatase [Parasphingopyxis sp.]|uniref:Ppx/GppA family phosphatase n=1 Tax=Parasphingopyxis sp. TaxID=1920299 RepID=UPI00262BDD19|nr:Ppx/GppA family phosphatase [Parasphingopyxis sp.]
MSVLSMFRTEEEPTVEKDGRTAVIDIGSNSIRLVVFDGQGRLPAFLFNEKVMVGLGARRDENGALQPDAIGDAMDILRRFRSLATAMNVTDMRAVATAAVREASNGGELIAQLGDIGIQVRLLSGEDEAKLAAMGVLSAIPGAEGLVGDLGGGSLELARVADGAVKECASFPLGVLRIAELRSSGKKGALKRAIAKALKSADWTAKCEGQPLYLVGGSWRALARVDMQRTKFPLPIVHHYTMRPERAAKLVRLLARIDKSKLNCVPSMASQRIPHLPDGAAILSQLVKQIGLGELVVSAYGLREGLLYERLDAETRAIDPLIAATREEGERQGRFPEHGDLLNRWIAPLFTDESDTDKRIRLAACLLADTGWRAHPEFRAERGLEMALHGNWVGIESNGRGKMAQALFTNFGGGVGVVEELVNLCSTKELEQAARWGLAMRFGQRLSGGVAEPLELSNVGVEANRLILALDKRDAELYSQPVAKRHRQLADAFGKEPEMRLI